MALIELDEKIEDIDSKSGDLENKTGKHVEILKTMQEGFVKNTALMFHEKSTEISKKLEMSMECFTEYFNAMLNEETNALKTSIEKDIRNVKKELQVIQAKLEDIATISYKNVEDIKELKEETTRRNKDIKVWVNDTINTTKFHWTIPDWPLVQKTGKDIVSDVFLAIHYGIKMRGKIMFKDGYMYPWIQNVYDSVFSKPYSFKYSHRRTFVINIRKDEQEITKLQLVQELVKNEYRSMKLTTDCWKFEWSRCKIVDADIIDIEIIIEPLEILYKDLLSKDGILNWKLEKYNQKKRDGMKYEHWIWSEDFYDNLGYRLKVGLYFHVDHVEFRLHSLYDEFDNCNKLRDYEATTIILDQSGSKDKRVDIETGECVGFNSHCQLAKLTYVKIEKSTFLKDDSIIVKVILEENVKT